MLIAPAEPTASAGDLEDTDMTVSIPRRPAALALATTLSVLMGAITSVHADDAKVVAGTLTCNGHGTVGMVLGSKETLDCTYAPAGGGPKHSFSGATTRVGLDVGVRGKSVMIWTVLGSTTKLPSEQLGGTYAGVSADVAAGYGVGANVLVGGNNKSIVLQPLSVKGETGLNIAVGVSSLKLSPM